METPKKTFQMMVAALGFHQKMRLHLERGGFRVRRVVRQAVHPVWEAHLNLGAAVPVGGEEDRLRQEIRSFLRLHNHHCSLKEISVSTHGDRLRAAFLWNRGDVGWMSFYGGKREWHPGYPY